MINDLTFSLRRRFSDAQHRLPRGEDAPTDRRNVDALPVGDDCEFLHS
jgi:hypothetical protein